MLDLDLALLDLGDLHLEQALHKARMDPADRNLGQAVGVLAVAVHLQDIHLDMVAGVIFLAGHEFGAFHDALGAAQLHINVPGVHAFHDTGQDFVFLVDVFVVDLAVFRVAEPLGDDLLGRLRRHTPEILRGHVHLDDVAQFIAAAHPVGVLQADLLQLVRYAVGNRFARIDLDIVSFGDHDAQVHRRRGAFDVFFVRGFDPFLHGFKDRIHGDILGLGQHLNRVINLVFLSHYG